MAMASHTASQHGGRDAGRHMETDLAVRNIRDLRRRVIYSEVRTSQLSLADSTEKRELLRRDMDALETRLRAQPSRGAHTTLAVELLRRGLAVARLTRRGIVGTFTVTKKRQRLRLIFDCRQVNATCKKPPKTHLSTAGALSQLRVDRRPGESSRPYRGAVCSVDLVDSFYRFE